MPVVMLLFTMLASATVSAAVWFDNIKTKTAFIVPVNAIIIFAVFFLATNLIGPLKKFIEGDSKKKGIIYLSVVGLAIAIAWTFKSTLIWNLKYIAQFLFVGGKFTYKPIVNLIILFAAIYFATEYLGIMEKQKKSKNVITFLVALFLAYSMTKQGDMWIIHHKYIRWLFFSGKTITNAVFTYKAIVNLAATLTLFFMVKELPIPGIKTYINSNLMKKMFAILLILLAVIIVKGWHIGTINENSNDYTSYNDKFIWHKDVVVKADAFLFGGRSNPDSIMIGRNNRFSPYLISEVDGQVTANMANEGDKGAKYGILYMPEQGIMQSIKEGNVKGGLWVFIMGIILLMLLMNTLKTYLTGFPDTIIKIMPWILAAIYANGGKTVGDISDMVWWFIFYTTYKTVGNMLDITPPSTEGWEQNTIKVTSHILKIIFSAGIASGILGLLQGKTNIVGWFIFLIAMIIIAPIASLLLEFKAKDRKKKGDKDKLRKKYGFAIENARTDEQREKLISQYELELEEAYTCTSAEGGGMPIPETEDDDVGPPPEI